MKRENLGWLVAGVVIALAVTMGAAQSVSHSGRWCLYNLDENVTNGGVRIPSVFLLDTQTGKTFTKGEGSYWVYIEPPVLQSFPAPSDFLQSSPAPSDATEQAEDPFSEENMKKVRERLMSPDNPFAHPVDEEGQQYPMGDWRRYQKKKPPK